MERVTGTQLILASKSPRRKELLMNAGLSFSIIPSMFDENSVCASDPETYVRLLSEGKASDVSSKYSDSWVIGADTIVLINNKILEKPKSRTDAFNMLKLLSGNEHKVLTGYCICCKTKNRFFSETISTEVSFKKLDDKEIEWYINTKEPFGKAGAYAIQGMGIRFVKKIKGSYSSVVGLPVCEVVSFLKKESFFNNPIS